MRAPHRCTSFFHPMPVQPRRPPASDHPGEAGTGRGELNRGPRQVGRVLCRRRWGNQKREPCIQGVCALLGSTHHHSECDPACGALAAFREGDAKSGFASRLELRAVGVGGGGFCDPRARSPGAFRLCYVSSRTLFRARLFNSSWLLAKRCSRSPSW